MTQSAEPAGPPILCSVEDGVGTVTLNRPHVLNAFNLAMGQGLLETLADLAADDGVRAIVLRGAGRVFSAGGDIHQMMDDVHEGEDRAAYFRAPLTTFGEVVLALRRTPKPVLAAVHGAAAGIAFNVMLACDLKVAAETARFTQAFIKLGLSPDGGGSWMLPRLVGHARAAELAFLPTELDAATARDWGLVNWVVPEAAFEETVRGIAARVAAGPRAALARTKSLLDDAWDHTLAEHIEAERLAQVANADSPDFDEGLTAFLEKRPPGFPG